MLSASVSNPSFQFNKELYQQREGLSMGNPIAPALANIFMSHLEESFIAHCPTQFKPLFYKRYLDDTFVLFSRQDQAQSFFNFINNVHPNIQFTMEQENSGKLPFLDTSVSRNIKDGVTSFETSVYRKPTFSGLGLSFFSHSSSKFKINAIKTLIQRAYKISSTYELFDKENTFLRNYFIKNGFPTYIYDSCIKRFLTSVYTPLITAATVAKKTIYLSIPYFGEQSVKMELELLQLIEKFYPQINPIVVFTNSFTIGSFFRIKDNLPIGLRSNIVYKFQCEVCNDSYIGLSTKTARFRWSQHLGISHRTSRPPSKLDFSPIRTHSENSDHPLTLRNFSILDQSSDSEHLRILESLYIYTHKPTLNTAVTCNQLRLI